MLALALPHRPGCGRRLNDELKGWLSFAKQKLHEISTLTCAINEGRSAVADELAASREAHERRGRSPRIHNPAVAGRLAAVDGKMLRRARPFNERQKYNGKSWACRPCPRRPSAPSRRPPRSARPGRPSRRARQRSPEYEAFCRDEIARAVRFQEEIGLDVLVHGECERSDMVEYFGEQLDGFAFTSNGWVQSYGTRCVKPPVIYGDVPGRNR